MTSPAIEALLALLVFAVWLGAVGFVRLRGPLDRLHCVAFANAVGAPLLIVAALVADGASGRVLKIAIVAAAVLLNGALLAHATGRALVLRRQSQRPPP